jgi:hypothetical protein
MLGVVVDEACAFVGDVEGWPDPQAMAALNAGAYPPV